MKLPVQAWFDRSTSRARDWPVSRLRADKGRTRVSVVLPALDEEPTVGGVVRMVRRLAEETGLVDEVVVMDSGSTDGTAEAAEAAGAVVHHRDDVLPEVGSRPGKGEVLWKSLAVTSGDVVVFVDADLVDPQPQLVTGLLGPLLADPSVELVKGCYDRPLQGSGDSSGGRVTELVARPLLARYFPELTGVVQPLAGEYAGRRRLLEAVPFGGGYGVEIAMLIDALRLRGLGAIAQVDLGRRRHSHQDTAALGRMAAQISHVVHERALGATGDRPAITQFARDGYGHYAPVTHVLDVSERPPMLTVEGYAGRAAKVS
ncbi:glucosyl-3-phosphoglycerate synthase [Paenibacillus sp. TRM 82003]|uniref:glucosyl-3-phosphoglycerate synthase n=1 Tax=Kineococcus sp. TRM81007 TaxID=2925831 RepID=UPI001F5968B7|nr:glucosyl-3-phosphoglycerate synthase [Kineococcus sp. TRM81007]MCI2236916.1 glucosyl-3-phosphoglycerate synthase [Kineococcus sp. TRM81007]MCI3921908.1 glucosyl-3-phosphoglycerate synthase [Paenibacillus sp. TRM 82003]